MLDEIKVLLSSKKALYVFPLIGAVIFLFIGLYSMPANCPLMSQMQPYVATVFGALFFAFIRAVFLLWMSEVGFFKKILGTVILMIPYGFIGFFLMILIVFSGDAC